MLRMTTQRHAQCVARKAMRKWISGRTQTECAARLGCSISFLNDWLLGRRELSFEVIAKWSAVTRIGALTFCKARLALVRAGAVDA